MNLSKPWASLKELEGYNVHILFHARIKLALSTVFDIIYYQIYFQKYMVMLRVYSGSQIIGHIGY